MADEKTFSVGVQTSSPKRISVTSNVSENPITATPDTGLYYSQLAKNWATGEGLIENTDYSSKAYAQESKAYALDSKVYSESANLDLNNLNKAISQYDEQITNTVATGLAEIESQKEYAITEVGNSVSEAVVNITSTKDNAIQDFDKHTDKINYLFVMPIGHIGISPFPIDETKGLQRLLNGQTIIQEQFTGFTKWLKDKVALYPSVACTEEEWQATVTMSINGTCDKFVIDDVAGTIRLPKYPEYCNKEYEIGKPTTTLSMGAVSIKGNGKALGLSKGDSTTYYLGSNSASEEELGGKSMSSSPAIGASGYGSSNLPDDLFYGVTTDASKSGLTGSVTGTATTNLSVTETMQKGYWFIQVATGAEETVDVTREIELNNPFFFGYYQYFDIAPNNISWLKSSGQWDSKTVYTDYYDWILTNANKGVENFKLSTDTYDDYSWVVNTADSTFRLPLKTNNLNNSVDTLSLYFYVGETVQNANLVNVGRIEETVVNKINRTGDTMTGNLTVEKNTTPIIYIKNSSQDRSVAASTNAGTQFLHLTDKNNAILGSVGIERYTNGRNTIKLQAFSVDGSTSPAVRVNAYANNTIGCEFPRCTTKATTTSSARNDLVAVVVQNYVSGTSWYRVWSDGWIEQGGKTSATEGAVTVTLLKAFTNTNYSVVTTGLYESGNTANAWDYVRNITTKNFVIYQQSKGCLWRACGY